LEYLVADGRMTLKSDPKERGSDVQDLVVRSCEHLNESSGFVQRWAVFWLDERLSRFLK